MDAPIVTAEVMEIFAKGIGKETQRLIAEARQPLLARLDELAHRIAALEAAAKGQSS